MEDSYFLLVFILIVLFSDNDSLLGNKNLDLEV